MRCATRREIGSAPRMARSDAIESELAHRHDLRHRLGAQLSRRDENPERDRQIERAPLPSPIGRREIDRHSLRRHDEPRIHERRTHALAALLHGARGQPDDGPLRQPLRRVDLHDHVVGIDAEDGGGVDGGEHATKVVRRHARPIISFTRAISRGSCGALFIANR